MSLHTLARVGKSVTERVGSFRTLYSISLIESMALNCCSRVVNSAESAKQADVFYSGPALESCPKVTCKADTLAMESGREWPPQLKPQPHPVPC